jgi:hypothetical protein
MNPGAGFEKINKKTISQTNKKQRRIIDTHKIIGDITTDLTETQTTIR